MLHWLVGVEQLWINLLSEIRSQSEAGARQPDFPSTSLPSAAAAVGPLGVRQVFELASRARWRPGELEPFEGTASWPAAEPAHVG